MCLCCVSCVWYVCGVCCVCCVCCVCVCCVCYVFMLCVSCECVVCVVYVCVLCMCCCCYVCAPLSPFLPLTSPSFLLQFPFFSLPSLEPCPSNVSGSFSFPCFYSADAVTSLLLAPYFYAWASLQPLPFPQEPRKPAEGPAVDAKAIGPACAAALP